MKNKDVNIYNTGEPLPIEKTEKEWAKMAKDFSEGNKHLENLLLTSWKNGINTFACCNGHLNEITDKYNNYIAFYTNTDEEAIILATNLFISLRQNPTIQIEIGKNIFSKKDSFEGYIGINKQDKIRRFVQLSFPPMNMPLRSHYYKLLTKAIKSEDMLKPQDNEVYKTYETTIKKLAQAYGFYNPDLPYDKREETTYCSVPFSASELLKYNISFEVHNVKNQILKTTNNIKNSIEQKTKKTKSNDKSIEL